MPAANTEIRVGSLASDFTLESNTGQEVTLSDYQGPAVGVLYFMREFT